LSAGPLDALDPIAVEHHQKSRWQAEHLERRGPKIEQLVDPHGRVYGLFLRRGHRPYGPARVAFFGNLDALEIDALIGQTAF
jgi:hypothetical protein